MANITYSSLQTMLGGTMARANNANFLLLGNAEDGYVRLSLSEPNMVATENRAAFDAEGAIANYEAHEREVVERKEKAERKKAEKIAADVERKVKRETDTKKAVEVLGNSDSPMTASEIAEEMGVTPMYVGSLLRNSDSVTIEMGDDGKRRYSVK